MTWFEIKDMIEALIGLDRDSLHIYAAVFVQLLTVLVLRSALSKPAPLLVVLCVVLANECADLSTYRSWDSIPDFFWDAAILDLWNSMLMPVILFLFARYWPGFINPGFVGNRAFPGESKTGESGEERENS